MITNYNKFLNESNNYTFNDLEKILLDENGKFVSKTLEEDLISLIEYGDFYEPSDYDYKIIKMNPSQCHSNSCSFYKNFIEKDGNTEEEIDIMTGWALGKNGMWVQHSWIFLPFDDIIVETTEERILYYGFMLDYTEVDNFLNNNI